MRTRIRGSHAVVATITAVIGLFLVVAGLWGLVDPASFARAVGFDEHHHFVHDAGAFQLGLGIALLLALIWPDALAVVLFAVFAGNTAHVVNHVVDLEHGGSQAQAWALGVASVLLAVAFVLRLRELGYVVGYVEPGASAALAPFVRQKTVNLTTFRRNGEPGRSPVSIAVDGETAYLRSFQKALKTRRVRRDPRVELSPATGFGRDLGSAVVIGRLRLLSGDEEKHAIRLLRRKHPMLHGVLVPLAHRAMRGKVGRTVHFELTLVRADGR